MQLARAAARRRFLVLICLAVALFGLGAISAARADGPAMSPATGMRQGVITERLRDCLTFERTPGESTAVQKTSR